MANQIQDITKLKKLITEIRKEVNQATDAQVADAKMMQKYIDEYTVRGGQTQNNLIETFAANKKAREKYTIELLGYLEEVEKTVSHFEENQKK